MSNPETWTDLGDGIRRPVVAQIEHDAEGGFVVVETVIGRHAGQVQDGVTLSLFSFRYPSGEASAALYPTLAEARTAAAADALS